MVRILRVLLTLFAIVGLAVVIDGSALAQPKGKDKDRKEGKEGKEHHVKQHKHHSGKDMVGDKVKKDGKHQFHQHGKHTAFVNVKGGKIAGVTVTHSEKGDVPVKKVKSTKKMAEAPTLGTPNDFVPVQTDLGTMWIGYSYIDDLGDEIIYWFPYEMILDGDTGAVDYVPLD